ncbi:MAG: BON domain-containing protein [Caldilinea sp. CFX5]|nr:BON domain-containing protein [Caldilinea sp. CFX5]
MNGNQSHVSWRDLRKRAIDRLLDQTVLGPRPEVSPVRSRDWSRSPIFATLAVWLFLLLICLPQPVAAQGQPVDDILPTPPTDETLPAPDSVQVEPTARDEAIAERLQTILAATEWFEQPTVAVREGVVFLDGRTRREEYRTWAGDLARNTQDVVAVVNRLQVVERSPWDFTPAFDELNNIARSVVQALPLIGFALLVLVIAWFAARLTAQVMRYLLHRQITNSFLRNLTALTLSIPVFLLGLYLVLQIAGLTRLAVTVLGGTGIAGLIVGITFRDIMENFLATILISTRNPFRTGDRIEVAGHVGIVQRVTTRATVLAALNGDHILIPNAVVYKSTIINYTVNPNRRLNFEVSIGYKDPIGQAQETILDVLLDHPAILKEPEPLVLVNALTSTAVNLQIGIWFNSQQYEENKLRSAAIRLVKRALQDEGFSLPDPTRQVIFPSGVPVQIVEQRRNGAGRAQPAQPTPEPTPEGAATATEAEGGLQSDNQRIRQQANLARVPEEETNLLESSAEDTPRLPADSGG